MEETNNKPIVDINDLTGLGKVLPVEKLLDVCSNSIGRIFKTFFDRKDVDTEAYRIRALAKANAEGIKVLAEAVNENSKLTGGIKIEDQKVVISSPVKPPIVIPLPSLLSPTLEERTQNRLNFQEAKKQLNIESVAGYAAEELKDEPPVTNEPLDEDWTTRFFKIVEDVSNEEMQALWGKILAGEIKQPKSYSLRTLELIRNLTKQEADTFIKVARFAIQSLGNNYLFKGNDDSKLSREYAISYSDIALLVEVGLIQTGDNVVHQYFQQPNDYQRVLVAGNVLINISIKKNTPTLMLPVYIFSKAGNELLNLNKPLPPFDYLTYLASSIKSEFVEVKYAFILNIKDNTVEHTLPLQAFE